MEGMARVSVTRGDAKGLLLGYITVVVVRSCARSSDSVEGFTESNSPLQKPSYSPPNRALHHTSLFTNACRHTHVHVCTLNVNIYRALFCSLYETGLTTKCAPFKFRAAVEIDFFIAVLE